MCSDRGAIESVYKRLLRGYGGKYLQCTACGLKGGILRTDHVVPSVGLVICEHLSLLLWTMEGSHRLC